MWNRLKTSPLFWSVLLFLVAQALAFLMEIRSDRSIIARLQGVPEGGSLTPPDTPLSSAVIYFLVVAAALGVVLFLIPLSLLRFVLKVMFALLFSWGTFIVLYSFILLPAAASVALVAGFVWMIKPKVWLHDILLILTLVGSGSVFAFMFAPWTFMAFMLIIAIYDIVAVRSGYMLWMAKKMSESNTLPAFVVPKHASIWTMDLGQLGFKKLVETETSEREYAVLGGGDIGFPTMLAFSVFFAYGPGSAAVVAVFAMLGLIGAFWIQSWLLKGKPMPALPPIAAASLIGFAIVYLTAGG